MKTFATLLIKVNPGTEASVRDWLTRKRDENVRARHCSAQPRRCKLISNEELSFAEGARGPVPCEELIVLAVACLPGPYDFAVVVVVPDIGVVQTFVVDCLRSWEIGKSIRDTHTVYGLLTHELTSKDQPR